MKSDNTKGNPNHDSLGRFSSSPSDSTSTKAGVSGSGNDSAAPSFSWLKKGQNSTTASKPQFSWLKKKSDSQQDSADDGQATQKGNSIWEQVKKERWWKSRELHDTQYIVDNIDKYYDDDMLDEIEKAGFHTTDKTGYFGRTNTSHSYINSILTNLVAKKMFYPVTVVPSDEFRKEWSIAQRSAGSMKNMPYSDTACITRGVHSPEDRLTDALGKSDNRLVLPNGVYGSCIYTAYDGHTAKSYAGYSGHVMSFLLDNKSANTIDETAYNSVRRNFRARLPEIENNLKESLKKRGKDDAYCDKIVRQFHNTAMNDATFPALLLGYDCVYNLSPQYSLILNYKHVKTMKDW